MNNIFSYNLVKIAVLILIIGLVSSSISVVAGSSTPAVASDSVSIGSYGDIASISVSDNGTHLIVHITYADTIFPFTRSYIVKYSARIYIDSDMNPTTGSIVKAGHFSFPLGAEAYIYGYTDSWGYRYVKMETYSASGSRSGSVTNNSWILLNSSGLYFTIPLSELSLGDGDLIRVVVEPRVDFRDLFPIQHYTNVTVNYTAVVVDGSDSEWNLSNSTIAVDDNDSARIPYPGINVTSLYMASDNRYLYFLLKLETPPNDSFYQADPGDVIISSMPILYALEIDVDNNGTSDYAVVFYREYGIIVTNLSNNVDIMASYPNAWNTTNVELALNISYIGLTSIVGQNISLQLRYLYSRIEDYPVNTSLYYGFVYEVGRGGHFAPSVNNYCIYGCYIFGNNTYTFGDLNLAFTLNGSSRIYVSDFDVSPIARGNHLPVVGRYYKFFVDNTSVIVWPIRASLKYNETLLASLGYGEEELKVYYFNASSKRFEVLSPGEYSIDTVNNTVYFNISNSVYGAGDPVIVLGGSPPVGGELVLYRSQDNILPLTMIMIGAMALAVSTGYIVYRRK